MTNSKKFEEKVCEICWESPCECKKFEEEIHSQDSKKGLKQGVESCPDDLKPAPIFCKKCGKDKEEHLSGWGKVKTYCSYDKPLQKFEEEMTDKELYESTLGRPFDKKPQKGCGEVIDFFQPRHTKVCGANDYLCEKCKSKKPKNHIPTGSKRDKKSSSSSDSQMTPEYGSPAHNKKPQNHSPQSGQESVKKVEKTSEGTLSGKIAENRITRRCGPPPEGTPEDKGIQASQVSLSSGTFTNLSEKKFKWGYGEEDVKTFIKKEQDLIVAFITEMITETEFWEKREKLAGDSFK